MTNSKVNKKKICIETADEAIATSAYALRILAKFKALGYQKRGDFVAAVLDKLPQYDNHNYSQKLISFWLMRLHDKEVNKDLKKVLKQLKPKQL